MSNVESSSLIVGSISFRERRDFLRGHEAEFGIQWTYRGTEAQNIALQQALKDPTLAKKFQEWIWGKEYKNIHSKSRDNLSNLRENIQQPEKSTESISMNIRNFLKNLLWRESNPKFQSREQVADRLTQGISAHEHTLGAQKLGKYVAEKDPPNTGKSSCGKAVGTILNNFWFSKYLPQSGRDGKNWDSILDTLVSRNVFKKVPCSHPKNALPGGVLVYNGGSPYGTEANKKYGHVEIKSDQWEYVSYVKARQPGWSARNAPDAKSMGFCGYVYYPV
jgi:hypothetical protein